MSNLVNVDSKEVEKKLSLVRRYTIELIVVALCFVVGYLFLDAKETKKELYNYITNDKISLVQKLDENGDIIKQNSIQLQQSTDALRDILKLIDKKNYTK